MTNEERAKIAIDAMKYFKQILYNGIYGEFVGNFDTAISAIEKQIPKNPIEDIANLIDFKTFHCPVCNKKIVSRLDGEWIAGRPQKYCDDCGQALDFNSNGSDTE